MNSRHIGWFIVTTGMITALPLVFEVRYDSFFYNAMHRESVVFLSDDAGKVSYD